MADNQESPPAELAPGVPQPQVVSNPSPVNEIVAGVMSMLAFGITFSTTMMSLVGQHDVSAIAAYISSAPVIAGISAIAGGGVLVYRGVIKKLIDKRRENIVVAAVPSAVAMTKGEVAAVKSAPTPEAAQAITQAIDIVAATVQQTAMAGGAVPAPPPSRVDAGNVMAPPPPLEGAPPPPPPTR